MLSFTLLVVLCMQACSFQIAFSQCSGTGSTVRTGNNLGALGYGGIPYCPGFNGGVATGSLGLAGAYGNIGPSAVGQYGASAYGNAAGAYGNVADTYYGNVAGTYGNAAGAYGNVAGAYGNKAGSYGNVAGMYGGNGNGEVVMMGKLPVSGSTAVTGLVPAMGLVQFGGNVLASGVVTIRGQCGCGCQNGRNY